MPSNYDNAPAAVREAIREAARLTGQDEGTLNRVINRESRFNPYAANAKSTAKGLGQHLDDTWQYITKKSGGKYGITEQTSRFDPRASALMTAELMKDNQAQLRKSLGRAPDGSELYMAHFMGAAGAGKLLAAATKTPGAAAADLFPKEAEANPSVFYDGKRKRALTEVVMNLGAIDGKGAATPGENPLALGGSGFFSPEPEPAHVPWYERLGKHYVAAAEQEQTQVMATQFALRAGDADLAPDENFRWTPDKIKALTGDLPEDYAKWVVENAHSDAHAADLVKRAGREMDNEADLAGLGMAGNLGMRAAAILTDVPTLLIGAGAGKLASVGRLGKLAVAGRAGLLAAAENLPSELVKSQARANYGMDDVLLGTTSALAMGAGFGAIFGRSGAELDEAFSKHAAQAQREVFDAQGTKLSAHGEEVLAFSAGPRMPTSGGSAAAPAPTGKAAWKFARVDIIGRLKSRANPELQELADTLDIDAVGDGGKTLRGGETAYEHMRRLSQTQDAQVRRTVDDAYKVWADKQGLSTLGKIRKRGEFNEAVYRELYKPGAETSDEIAKAAEAYRAGYAKYLNEAKAAGAKWAEEVQPDKFYVPIVFDKNRVREMIARFDEDGVVSVIRQAMRAANEGITDQIAQKAAEKYLRVVQDVTEGTQGSMVHVISGQDREGLRDLLVEQGMTLDEAETVTQVLKPVEKTGPGHFRKRTLLDDTTQFVPTGASKLKPGETLSIRDLTVQDAEQVWEKYSRQMAGQVAMVQRGFQNRGAFAKRAAEVTKGLQNTKPGYTDSMAKADLTDLEYLGKTIYGIPVRDMDNVAGKLESIFGSWNFMRFMGQSGIAQLGDVPKIMLKTSVSAAWNTFRLGDMAQVFKRGGQEADVLARDLEVITGVGTINARGRVVQPFRDIEEFYPESLSDTALDRGVRFAKTGANITAMVSGMVPVTDFLGRWATRASMQHLADVSRGVKKLSPEMLNDMGLGSSELARFKSLVEKMDVAPNGVVRDLKLAELQKLDPAGVDLMGAWISRQARLTVLEPTPGMLPRFMGDSPARLLMQFRTFSMASHAANTLHNLKMGNAYFAQSLMVTGAWASLIYMGQTYMRSVGQPDREEFLEDRLNPMAIAAGAFTKSADSGFLPQIIDTAMWPVYEATDTESPFAYGRTTGLAAGIQGVPTISLLADLERAAHEGVADLAREDKQFTRQDYARWNRLLPLNNTYGVANAMAALSDLFPEREND